jgi:hypothetical protein
MSTSVTVYEGGVSSSGGACPGDVIGSLPIDNNGEFKLRTTVASIVTNVCVRGSDGQIATSPVEQK